MGAPVESNSLWLRPQGESVSRAGWPGCGHDILVEENVMHKPIKYFEKGLVLAAAGAWHIFERCNRSEERRVGKECRL